MVTTTQNLPFPECDLLAVRLLPAEFARTVGVSRQTVSRWIRDAKVTLGADGRVNPNVAMRQLLRNGDPGRIRARLVKQAFADMADLREQAGRTAVVDGLLADAQRQIRYLKGFSDELALASEIAVDVLTDSADEIRPVLSNRDALRVLFADLLDRALLLAGDALGHDSELASLAPQNCDGGEGSGRDQLIDTTTEIVTTTALEKAKEGGGRTNDS